jgi:hypothetical protein
MNRQMANKFMIYEYTKAQAVLTSVIEILATFPGDMRSRLNCAYSELDSISETNLPEEFRKSWKLIKDQLTKHGARFDYRGKLTMGSVENTMSKIRNSTACKIADQIYKIYYELNHSEKFNKIT